MNTLLLRSEVYSLLSTATKCSAGEDTYEHWTIKFPDENCVETTILLAITCKCCGNYICVSNNIIHKNAKCNCSSEYDNFDTVKKRKQETKSVYTLQQN